MMDVEQLKVLLQDPQTTEDSLEAFLKEFKTPQNQIEIAKEALRKHRASQFLKTLETKQEKPSLFRKFISIFVEEPHSTTKKYNVNFNAADISILANYSHLYENMKMLKAILSKLTQKINSMQINLNNSNEYTVGKPELNWLKFNFNGTYATIEWNGNIDVGNFIVQIRADNSQSVMCERKDWRDNSYNSQKTFKINEFNGFDNITQTIVDKSARILLHFTFSDTKPKMLLNKDDILAMEVFKEIGIPISSLEKLDALNCMNSSLELLNLDWGTDWNAKLEMDAIKGNA